MKKRILFLSLILIFAVFLGDVYAADKVIVKRITKDYSGGFGYDLYFMASYPKISGMDDVKAQNQINRTFRKNAQDAEKRARDTAKELSKHRETRKIKVTGIYDFKVTRNKGGIVSMIISDYLYSGGTHGITAKKGITINTTTGQVYTLASLFNENVDYVKILNRLIEKQIEARGLSNYMLTEFKGIRKDQEFFLTNNSLVIFFEQYQYFPRRYGFVKFRIPFKVLNGLMIEDIIIR